MRADGADVPDVAMPEHLNNHHCCCCNNMTRPLLLNAAAFAAAVLASPLVVPVLVSALAPEIPAAHLSRVSRLVSEALGDKDVGGGTDATMDSAAAARYASVRSAVADFNRDMPVPANELVYGELSVPTLGRILDAVGLEEQETFLDVGSGDGACVLGASLLYNQDDSLVIPKCIGVEIVPGLVDRSEHHAENLADILQREKGSGSSLRQAQAQVEFLLGDIHDSSDRVMSRVLSQATVVVCFATTWCASNTETGDKTSLQGRRLPNLSQALSALKRGARVVIIDGKLNSRDGFAWQGDLRIVCPDTAPYSTATLYHKQ